MKSSKIAFLVALGLLLGAFPFTALSAQEGAQESVEETFVDQIEVTVVELRVDVRDKKGRLISDLSPADFEILEDGEPVKILGIDRVSSSMQQPVSAMELQEEALGPAVIEPGGGDDWRFLIYIDAPMSSPRSTAKSAESLSAQAEQLTALGPVEIVVANPAPRLVLPFTKDTAAVRRALASLDGVSWQGHDMSRIRRDFLRVRDLAFHGTSVSSGQVAELRGQILSAVRTERSLMQRQILFYYDWIATYGSLPGSVSMLVADGFDIEPGEFYLNVAALPGLNLGMELDEFRLTGLTEELAATLAARSWTNMIFSAGGGSPSLDAVADASLAYRDRFRSIAEAGDLSTGPSSNTVTSLLVRPLEPLQIYAGVTGGEVVTTPKRMRQAVEKLNERYRLTYQVERPSDGARHRVKVKAKRKGVQVMAPEWVTSPTPEMMAEARARRLLVLAGDAGEIGTQMVIGQPDDTLRRKLSVQFDLNLLAVAMPGRTVPIRFTLGVALDGEPPFLHHVVQEVKVPQGTSDPAQMYMYELVLALPKNAVRAAMIVEEPTTGIWGGTSAEMD